MNYLAHLYFGRKTEPSLVGNLMGDFVKGNEESLREIYPNEVVDGVLMHRKIDVFTDAHQHFHEAKILLGSNVVRYAGVVLDIFFDHFLAKHWDKYGENELSDFIEHCHKTLSSHQDWLSPELKEALPSLISHDVLASYENKSGVKLALERISKRSKHGADFTDAYADFERNYDEFEKIFKDFFPIVSRYASTLAPSNALECEPESVMSDSELILTWRQGAIVMAEKNYRIESICTFFINKGVSASVAETEAEQIIKQLHDRRCKQSKYLLYPAIFCLIVAPLLCTMHWYVPVETLRESPFRNLFAGVFAATFGLIFLAKSKTIR